MNIERPKIVSGVTYSHTHDYQEEDAQSILKDIGSRLDKYSDDDNSHGYDRSFKITVIVEQM